MRSHATGLSGFRGMRGELLVALKRAQPLTAKELAELFGVTPNGQRRHLKALEEDGLVRYRREVRGVGGPVFAYSLTEAGEALFPRQYDSTLALALGAIRETQGTEAVVQVLRQQWAAVAQGAEPLFEGLPLNERAQLLAELLTSHGYMAEANSDGSGEATIREHNCALRGVAERFPEICAAEARFLADVLGAEVDRREHMLSGCSACEYHVRFKPAQENS
jgi:DeoR family suf operon transcriptional repressor